jgi:hypothetical protein
MKIIFVAGVSMSFHSSVAPRRNAFRDRARGLKPAATLGGRSATASRAALVADKQIQAGRA